MSALWESPLFTRSFQTTTRQRFRRILLVEADVELSRVLQRELARHFRVTAVSSMAAALEALGGRARGSIEVAVVNYRLGRGAPSPALLEKLASAWPTVRRVLYGESRVPQIAARLVHAVVHMPGEFETLIRAIDGRQQ